MANNFVRDKIEGIVLKEDLLGNALASLQTTWNPENIKDHILGSSADSKEKLLENLTKDTVDKIQASKTKLREEVNLRLSKNIAEIRDIVILSKKNFRIDKDKKILESNNDFTGVIFKGCTFGELTDKNFTNAVFDNCIFTGDIKNCNLEGSIFVESKSESKQKPIYDAKVNPIKIINCTFKDSINSVSLEEFSNNFKGHHGCNQCLQDIYKDSRSDIESELKLHPQYQKAEFSKFMKIFTAQEVNKISTEQRLFLKEIFDHRNFIDTKGNIALSSIFTRGLKNSCNIPKNAQLELQSFPEPKRVYRASSKDIEDYRKAVKEDLTQRDKEINNILIDLNSLKGNVDFLSSLLSLLSVIDFLKEEKDDNKYQQIFAELYEFLCNNEDCLSIINEDLRDKLQLVIDKESVKFRDVLTPKLFNALNIESSQLRLTMNEKRKELNIKSFREYLKSAKKIDDATDVEIFGLKFSGDMEYLNFSNCSLKRIDFDTKSSFKYMDFSNSLIQFCESEGYPKSKYYVQFIGCIFDDATISGSTFKLCDLTGSSFHNSIIRSSDFSSSNLSQTDFFSAFAALSKAENATINKSDFYKSKLILMNFDHAKIENSNFREAFLYKSSFRNAEIFRCDFERAYLDEIEVSYAKFQECILRNTQKLVLEGREAFFGLCDIRKNKLMELGQSFNTLDLKYTPEDLKNLSPTMQKEFKSALIREANRKYYTEWLGKYGKYISDFMPDKVQTTMRLLSPILSQKKQEFKVLLGVTVIAAVMAGIISKFFSKKQQLAIKLITAGLYICFVGNFLSKFYGIKLIEDDSKVLELDNVTTSFKQGLEDLKAKMNIGFSKAEEEIGKNSNKANSFNI